MANSCSLTQTRIPRRLGVESRKPVVGVGQELLVLPVCDGEGGVGQAATAKMALFPCDGRRRGGCEGGVSGGCSGAECRLYPPQMICYGGVGCLPICKVKAGKLLGSC